MAYSGIPSFVQKPCPPSYEHGVYPSLSTTQERVSPYTGLHPGLFISPVATIAMEDV